MPTEEINSPNSEVPSATEDLPEAKPGANLLFARFLPASPLIPTLNSPIFWLAAFVLLNFIVPFFDISSQAIAVLGALSLTFAYIAIVLCFAATVALRRLSLTSIIVAGVLALCFWLLMDKVIAPGIMQPLVAELRSSRAQPSTAQMLQILLATTFTDLAILLTAVCGGNLAARMIRSPNMIGPVCVALALVDIWGVLFGGITKQMLDNIPEVAEKAMTKGPLIGAATSSTYAIPLPAIGFGDYLFIGLLLGVLVIHNLNWRAAMNWIAPLVCVTLFSISFGLIPYALPGLVPIALGAAIPNRQVLLYTREEKFAFLYAGILVVILMCVLNFISKNVLQKPSATQQKSQFNPIK